ncbi:MAG: folylpolyglutamate synthase/dihydrofolate synthase family protein [Candidatus Micrarchaeota archaeon]
MDYKKAIAYLESLPAPKKWALETPSELANLMGLNFNYEVVHAAGTNGKGSVCAFVSSILQAAGYKTGLYTSPHLQKYNERVQIGGKEISDSEFAGLIAAIKPKIEQMKKNKKCPSQFEALTIAALKYFEKNAIQILVMETGMGGRLDATNIVPSRVQAITSISFDHAADLGNNLSRIAFEKAGIIKQNSFVSTTCRDVEALGPIIGVCRRRNAKLSTYGAEFSYVKKNTPEASPKFYFGGKTLRLDGLKLGLLGEHQYENASLALSIIENLIQLGYSIPESAIRKGLACTKWPGRLEMLAGKPAILLDGAHNAGGMKALKSALESVFRKKYGKLILVLGIMADKDYPQMLEIIAPVADELILTRAAIDRSAAPETLETALGKLKGKPKLMLKSTLKGAISYAKAIAHPNDLICISGSLYLVGEARTYLLKTSKS